MIYCKDCYNADMVSCWCKAADPDQLPACIVAEFRMTDIMLAARIGPETKFEKCPCYVSSNKLGYVNGKTLTEDTKETK